MTEVVFVLLQFIGGLMLGWGVWGAVFPRYLDIWHRDLLVLAVGAVVWAAAAITQVVFFS